jgi:riboflavin kinase/FMN adenylyltransferase
MRVARSLEEAAEFGPLAVTIGNFDGVHLGHRKLLHTVVGAASERSVAPAVLTFDPHPAAIVGPQRTARLLTTHAERCTVMAREGIEYVLILSFTNDLSQWPPEKFVELVLAQAMHARVVVVGENFRFGHRQAGDVNMLKHLGGSLGFETRVAAPVRWRHRVISSSAIRRAVEAGHVSLAGRMLGRCFALEGGVVKGHGIGSKQTVPTLNLHTCSQVLPGAGVYITRTTELAAPERRWNSITNVGNRPTFSGDAQNLQTIETFLLDRFDPPTPETIRVEFLRRVRDEKKFESPEALKSQIMHDVSRAQIYFHRLATAGRNSQR